jgi:hypothetical protein
MSAPTLTHTTVLDYDSSPTSDATVATATVATADFVDDARNAHDADDADSDSSDDDDIKLPDLSIAQVNHFLEHGYVVLPLLSLAEVASIRQEVRNIVISRTLPSGPPMSLLGDLSDPEHPDHDEAVEKAGRDAVDCGVGFEWRGAGAGANASASSNNNSNSNNNNNPFPPYFDLDLLLNPPPSSTPASLHSYVSLHYPTLTSTGGAGGVLDVHYDKALDRLRTDKRLLFLGTCLMTKSYGDGRDGFQLPDGFPDVEWNKLLSSHDRICVRLPDKLAYPPTGTAKEMKLPKSRGLTPHLDCCPTSLYTDVMRDTDSVRRGEEASDCLIALQREYSQASGEERKGIRMKQWEALCVVYPHLSKFTSDDAETTVRNAEKWLLKHTESEKEKVPKTIKSAGCKKFRPVQCFVSLSDATREEHGGIEIAGGYHRTFGVWASGGASGSASGGANGDANGGANGDANGDANSGTTTTATQPLPCIGKYTAIRSKDICNDIKHVSVPAGHVIFWDNKLPHATSRRHDGDDLRMGVYVSLLPKCVVNDRVVAWERKCRKGGVVGVGEGNWVNNKEKTKEKTKDSTKDNTNENDEKLLKALRDRGVFDGLEKSFVIENEWKRGKDWDKSLKGRHSMYAMGLRKFPNFVTGD